MAPKTLKNISWLCLVVMCLSLLGMLYPWYNCTELFPHNAALLIEMGVLEADSVLLEQQNATAVRYVCWRAYPVHQSTGLTLLMILSLVGGVAARMRAFVLQSQKDEEGQRIEEIIQKKRDTQHFVAIQAPIEPVKRAVPEAIEIEEDLGLGSADIEYEGLDEDSASSLMKQLEAQQREIEETTGATRAELTTSQDGFYCPLGTKGAPRVYVDPSSSEATDRYTSERERVNSSEHPFETIAGAVEFARELIKRHQTRVQIRIMPGVYQSTFTIPAKVSIINHRMPAGVGLEEHLQWLLSLKELDHPDRVTILPPLDVADAVAFESGGHQQGLYGCHIVSRENTEQRGVYGRHLTNSTLYCCIIEGFQQGGAMFETSGHEEPGLECRIEGCVFTQNVSADGGGLCLRDSVFKVERCMFKENIAFRGGGLFAERGKAPLHLEGCEFRENKAQTAQRPQDLATLPIEDFAKIEGIGGGACFLRTAVKMIDCHNRSNGASVAGGAIGAISSKLNMVGKPGEETPEGVFRECKARWGGGLFAVGWNAAESVIKGKDLSFRQNEGHHKGGAVCVLGKTQMQIQDGEFIKNTCAADDGVGGGIMVWFGAELRAAKLLFYANEATVHGGAICTRNASLRLKNRCTFQDNVVKSGAAGAIFFESTQEAGLEEKVRKHVFTPSFTFTLADCEFVGNLAEKGASAVFVGSLSRSKSYPVTCQMARSLAWRANRLLGARGVMGDVLVIWGGETLQKGRGFEESEFSLT